MAPTGSTVGACDGRSEVRGTAGRSRRRTYGLRLALRRHLPLAVDERSGGLNPDARGFDRCPTGSERGLRRLVGMALRPSTERDMHARLFLLREVPLWLWRQPEAQPSHLRIIGAGHGATVHVRLGSPGACRPSSRGHVVEDRRPYRNDPPHGLLASRSTRVYYDPTGRSRAPIGICTPTFTVTFQASADLSISVRPDSADSSSCLRAH